MLQFRYKIIEYFKTIFVITFNCRFSQIPETIFRLIQSTLEYTYTKQYLQNHSYLQFEMNDINCVSNKFCESLFNSS